MFRAFLLFKILFYIFVYRTARSGSYNLKQITQMESVNYTELATIVFGLSCIIVLLIFGVVYAVIRIGQIQSDFVREDANIYNYIEQEKAKIQKEIVAHSKFLDKDIQSIKDQLNQPLYEVGNTIWYNKGNNGEQGVHQDLQGVIISIEPSCGEPHYKVNGQGGIEETIRQSHITAWTN